MITETLVFAFLFFFIFSSEANAYLDPFTGGILIKILVFIFSLFIVFFKKVKKFLNWIKRKILVNGKPKD